MNRMSPPVWVHARPTATPLRSARSASSRKNRIGPSSSPTCESSGGGQYPVSRSLYFYVKNAHVGQIPGIREYLQEFTSEKAWGEEGYLTEKGMIPMPEEERSKFAADAKNLTAMSM